MSRVKFEKVTKRFGKLEAIKDFNLEIKDKEFMVLVGPSGCGKSTVLRLIAGLETPSEGKLYIGEEVVNHLLPKERDIAMVFQSYALYPHKNVYDNIAFPLKIKKYPKEEIKEKVEKVAELLGIQNLLNRKPRELSGGQRQRVALGRAIVREPKVFLMDEPLSNLDAELRVKMRAELKKLQKKLGITTIYVTHDQVEAMTMGDRIAIIRNGLLQQVGEPNVIYQKPVNKFVAGFIGSPPMNFNYAIVVEKDGNIFLDLSDFELPLRKDQEEVLKDYIGKEIIMGIRPIYLYEKRLAKDADNKCKVLAKIEVIEPLGSAYLVHLNTGENTFVAEFPPDNEVEIGKEIEIVLDIERIHAFDKKTEEAIL
ncbi:MAG: ABC transporter ATP-binding protein [Methanosarcinales archaeon]